MEEKRINAEEEAMNKLVKEILKVRAQSNSVLKKLSKENML